MNKDLKKLFDPESVVVIGASGTPHKPGNDVIRNILANNYGGRLYLVNPKGGEILGIQVHRSIDELPEGIDIAIILLSAKDNPGVIRACMDQGIRLFVLEAGGFAEAGEQGEALQRELRKLIDETGIRVIGPNTSGHISTPSNFTSSFFPLGKIPRGTISYINQTGNFATHTMRHIMTAEHFGVARVVGLGNKIDLDESDMLEYLGEDVETKAIVMYLESIERPRRFMETARRVTKTKPVILLKGGSTVRGVGAVGAHTASLASDDRILDGALRQVGVVRIHKYAHLVWVAKALDAMPLPHGNRVSLFAPSGAMLVVLTDFCQNRLGLEFPDLEETTQERLQQISPPYIRMRNPVDIWPAASIHGIEYAYREGIEAVLRDRNIDALVVTLMLTRETGTPPLDFIVDLAKRYPEKPLYVSFTGDKDAAEEAKAFLEPRGVPTFPLIEEPLETLSILVKCRQAQKDGRTGGKPS
jgi:acyl-CoA synthetase (NDP forming)